MSRHLHGRATANDTLFETFVAAASGGGVIVFFFLVLDLIAGQALATPSFAGQVILGAGESGASWGIIDTGAVASMTALHLAAFILVGYVASKAVRGIEGAGIESPLASAASLFVLLQVPALVAAAMVWPELGAQVGHGWILVANALSASTMTLVLRAAHSTSTEASISREESMGAGMSVPA